MNRRNSVAVILCGIVTGVLFFLLTVVTLALFARDALSVLQTAPKYPKLPGGFFFAIDVLMGIWTIWLYSALSSRHGSGLRTGLLAGLAWWTMKALQSANWVGLGFVPLSFVPAPLVTSLVSAMVATVAGVVLYELVQRQPHSAAQQPKVGTAPNVP